jgi:hypothetical protein
MTLMRTISTFGAAGLPPDGVPLTAADFASLPATAEDGSIYAITAETGITGLAVRYSTSATAWLVTSATCSYAILSGAQWASTAGAWYDAGGIVVRTADGAQVRDTTYARSLRWRVDSTPSKSAFFPADIGWIANVNGPIKGDSISPAGWVVTGSPTTDGTKITMSATRSTAGTTDLRFTLTDSGLATGGNAYMAALVQTTTKTHTGSANAITTLRVLDGARLFMLGNQVGNPEPAADGRWTTTGFSLVSAQAANDVGWTTAESLVEFVKIGNTCAARSNGGQWHDVSGASCAATAAKEFILQASVGVTSGSATVTMTLRHVVTARS